MIGQVLQQLIDDRETSAREMGDLAGVAPSTVYRWLDGQSEPDFNSVRLIFRHLKSRNAQQAILGALMSGTGWTTMHAAPDLDVNHDGRVDCDDALDAAIQSVDAAGDALQKVRQCTRDRAVTVEEAVRLSSVLDKVIRDCSITQQIMSRVSQSPPRRKAKV